MFYSDAFAY